MKIDIISGFLGAGKTTLIKKLIQEELKKERLAIIENEYGEVGIDGSLLKEEQIEVKEITSGCICCSIKGDFKDSILSIVDQYKPERIIIEPSGVAKFSEVLEGIKSANIPGARVNMKIAVVDAQNVEMYMRNFGEFYKNQIMSANTIILSRTQYLNHTRIDNICNILRSINKNCELIATPWEQLTSKRILEVCEQKIEKLITTATLKKPALVSKSGASAVDVFDNWAIETSRAFNKNQIRNILHKLEKEKIHGEILRVKGIVSSTSGQWIKFDFVPNDAQITDYSSDYIGRICVIGKDLNKDSIKELFLK